MEENETERQEQESPPQSFPAVFSPTESEIDQPFGSLSPGPSPKEDGISFTASPPEFTHKEFRLIPAQNGSLNVSVTDSNLECKPPPSPTSGVEINVSLRSSPSPLPELGSSPSSLPDSDSSPSSRPELGSSPFCLELGSRPTDYKSVSPGVDSPIDSPIPQLGSFPVLTSTHPQIGPPPSDMGSEPSPSLSITKGKKTPPSDEDTLCYPEGSCHQKDQQTNKREEKETQQRRDEKLTNGKILREGNEKEEGNEVFETVTNEDNNVIAYKREDMEDKLNESNEVTEKTKREINNENDKEMNAMNKKIKNKSGTKIDKEEINCKREKVNENKEETKKDREEKGDDNKQERKNCKGQVNKNDATFKECKEEDMEEDKEEGELEEGELEDEGEDGEEEAEKNDEASDTMREQKDSPKAEKADRPVQEKSESKEQREKEERKRKHRDPEEEKKKKKKRKHHFSSEDEDVQKKKKFPPARDKASYDFDTLLKQEMYLVGSSSNPEGYSPDEEQYKGPPFLGPNLYRDGDSFGSGSGDDWDEKPRRRGAKRKRRGSRSPSRKNEAICMFYLQGSCKRGIECPYSHEIAPTRKMELCKFYMMDCCAKKEKCLYMHNDFPCKYFHFGMKCKAGEMCKFSHDPLQEVTKTILLKHIELAPKDILGDFPRVSKHNAQVILAVTEAKRRGETVDPEPLEQVLDLEGKGFKYLDRALKNIRKKKDVDKKGDKVKEEKENSKKAKSKDDSRDTDKERDKVEKKDRERNKDRDRIRDKGRRRSKNDTSYGSQRSRDFYQHPEQQPHDQQNHAQPHHSNHQGDYGRDRESYGRGFSPRGPSGGSGNHSVDPNTKWYSSDEEQDQNGSHQPFHRHAFGSPPGRHNRSGGEAPPTSEGMGHGGSSVGGSYAQFQIQPNLPDIDVSYLKNVLNAVQIHSSQASMAQGDQTIRRDNQWDSRSSSFDLKNSSRGNRPSFTPYMDMANDIKEVFSDSIDTKDFNRNLDCLLQSARGRQASDEVGVKDSREDRRGNFRSTSGFHDVEDDWSFKKDRENLSELQQMNKEDEDQRRSLRDSRFSRDGYWEEERVRHHSEDSRDDSRGEISQSKAGKIFHRRPSEDSDNSVGNSIYDLDPRQIDRSDGPSSIDEGGLGNMPFRVPIHSSAKEIDASLNPLCPVRYIMVRVDVPKPDFSRLKINRDDPKAHEDPRLRKMISILEGSPRSPRGECPVASPSYEGKSRLLDRDPRKLASRDPRSESKVGTRDEMRGDPRIASRGRVDPRIDKRDPRMDPRETMIDLDMREPDPRVGGPMFLNGALEGPSYNPFPANMGLPNPMMQQNIDPRGRPGLLGPAPNQGLPQSLTANPFLLSPGMGGPGPGPFITGDRGDMIGGSNAGFPPNQWGSGRINFSDPRLNRDVDMGGSFTPSSVS